MTLGVSSRERGLERLFVIERSKIEKYPAPWEPSPLPLARFLTITTKGFFSILCY